MSNEKEIICENCVFKGGDMDMHDGEIYCQCVSGWVNKKITDWCGSFFEVNKGVEVLLAYKG